MRQQPLDESMLSPDVITIVSGLPRSGTSLAMQMLSAGGVPIVTDDRRAPDEANPRGYFEDQRVVALARDASWLGEARGAAIKIVAPLLRYLPPSHQYRVIWMERSLDQVLASQRQMLQALGTPADPAEEPALAVAFRHQQAAARQFLAERGVPMLSVLHAMTIAEPLDTANQIRVFLDREFDVASAATAVLPALHRQRS